VQHAAAKGLLRFNRRHMLAMAAAGALTPRAAFAADKVNIAISNSTGDFAILIAIKKGYFAEEGLDVNGIVFDSGGKMIAPLGSGEIDVATGSASATLFNAVSRGIKLRIVADKGSIKPGYAYAGLVIRKDLMDSGRYRTLADLAGLRIAVVGRGTSNASALNEALTNSLCRVLWLRHKPAFPDSCLAG
jgi:NitT/TauT family transport system substrate-binding protein